jgi:hypothetical protein
LRKRVWVRVNSLNVKLFMATCFLWIPASTGMARVLQSPKQEAWAKFAG